MQLFETVLQHLPVLQEGVEAGNPFVGTGINYTEVQQAGPMAPVLKFDFVYEGERKKRPETAAVSRRTRDEYKKSLRAGHTNANTHIQHNG